MSKIKINDLYTSILNCGGLVVDKDGFVSVKRKNENTPATISGKRIVIPLHNQLTNSDWSNRIVFHPLSENILRSESDVISALRSIFNTRLNYTFFAIAQNLLSVVASIGEHHKLSPEQSEILSILKKVDETTVSAFTNISLKAIEMSADKSFLNIYLKRGGSVGNKKYSRVGVVTFPFLTELNKKQDKYYGVTLRPKDREIFIQLYEYLLPSSAEGEIYNRGSDSDIAPYLDSLMKTVMGIASRFNDVLSLFDGLIDAEDELEFNADWVEAFDNLSILIPQIRQIPMQAGNEGKARASDTSLPAPVQTPEIPAPFPIQPAANYGHLHHRQNDQPQVRYDNQPMIYPPQPAQPEIVETERGVDFQTFLRSHPSIAANVAMSPPFMQARGGMMAVQDIPRWAQGQPQQTNQGFNQGFTGGFNQGFGGFNQQPSNQWGTGRV